MTRVFKRRGLGLAVTLGAVAAVGMATPMLASAAPTTAHGAHSVSVPRAKGGTQHIAGVIPAQAIAPRATTPPPPEPAFNGTPPLLFHPTNCIFAPCENGAVLMTHATGPLIITPIFWDPAGHSMTPGYKGIITQYLSDVARASGQNTNVFSVANEYFGTNGQIHYNIQLGSPINDRSALPAD